MHRRRAETLQSIYGLLLRWSMLVLMVLLSGCSPKKVFMPF